jgi:two-component system, NarL family, response regulator YdfI
VIRVFIVAASPWLREGLQSQLASPELEIAGSARNLDLAPEEWGETEPGVLLIVTPGDTAGESIAELEGIASRIPVVILCDEFSADLVPRALRGGVRAVLPANLEAQNLRTALQAVAAGLVVLHPDEVGATAWRMATARVAREEPVEGLTPREREVLHMLADGLANKEIAARLKISEHTAKSHVASILGKLGAATRTEAVSMGIRRGLILL